MKRILTLTAVAAMVFTACSKEESTAVSYTHLTLPTT